MIAKPKKITHDLETTWFPSNVKRRWPAIIFAAKRTDSVIGRIMFLIISIRTMKGIKGAGVPAGTRCAKNSVILFNKLNEIKANQKGRAKASVIAKCLVAVNLKEVKPIVLLSKININNEENIKILCLLFFNKTLNSLFIVIKILLIKFLKGEARIQ